MGGARGGGRRHYHNLMYLTSHQTASAILLLAHSTFPRLRGSVLLHHTFWESRQPYGSLLFLLSVLFLFVTPCSSQFFFVNVTVQEVRVLFHFVTPWLPSVTFRSSFSSLSMSKKQWSFFLFRCHLLSSVTRRFLASSSSVSQKCGSLSPTFTFRFLQLPSVTLRPSFSPISKRCGFFPLLFLSATTCSLQLSSVLRIIRRPRSKGL